ncbi:bifunctional molybdenum cofactor biosynthesis protein MoaC/MoaB [Plantibacter flavus]|uniref:bifunctional molybdenum cofactor biosynthesis protein MoaC/MoaB n=1 Tax=Plantibacter flavus TaxID=150123 RepID=UPI003F17C184
MTGLTHLDDDGRARMVDVGDKTPTKRAATATATFTTRPDVIALVQADGLPKADVIATARIAGIAGAKRTSELIPLCHQLALSSVSLDFAFTEDSIVITATAKTTGPTGVEMEALTAASIAGLTLHDMVKAVDPASVLGDIRLLEKSGGKRGDWTPGSDASATPAGTAPPAIRPKSAAVIVASTAGAAGTREDLTGPRIASWFADHGYSVDAVTVVADAEVHLAIAAALAESPAVLITTGGTGLSPSDRTPEATRPHLDRELPGVAEAIRALGLTKTPTAALSRGLAGVANGTVVVNLPGSTGGVKDGLSVLDGLLDHLVAQIAGGGAHE